MYVNIRLNYYVLYYIIIYLFLPSGQKMDSIISRCHMQTFLFICYYFVLFLLAIWVQYWLFMKKSEVQ